MDQAHVAQQFESSVRKNRNRFVIIVVAATVTLMAIPPISARWHTYDWVSKLIAIMFLFILVTKPMFDIMVEAKGEQAIERFRSPLDAYVVAILAILLFARH